MLLIFYPVVEIVFVVHWRDPSILAWFAGIVALCVAASPILVVIIVPLAAFSFRVFTLFRGVFRDLKRIESVRDIHPFLLYYCFIFECNLCEYESLCRLMWIISIFRVRDTHSFSVSKDHMCKDIAQITTTSQPPCSILPFIWKFSREFVKPSRLRQTKCVEWFK